MGMENDLQGGPNCVLDIAVKWEKQDGNPMETRSKGLFEQWNP